MPTCSISVGETLETINQHSCLKNTLCIAFRSHEWIDEISSMRAMQAIGCSMVSLWYNGIASLPSIATCTFRGLCSGYASRILILPHPVSRLLCEYSITCEDQVVNPLFTIFDKNFQLIQKNRDEIGQLYSFHCGLVSIVKKKATNRLLLFQRLLPRKNSASVPGPECAPMTGPT